jgi:hypothetical protein
LAPPGGFDIISKDEKAECYCSPVGIVLIFFFFLCMTLRPDLSSLADTWHRCALLIIIDDICSIMTASHGIRLLAEGQPAALKRGGVGPPFAASPTDRSFFQKVLDQ